MLNLESTGISYIISGSYELEPEFLKALPVPVNRNQNSDYILVSYCIIRFRTLLNIIFWRLFYHATYPQQDNNNCVWTNRLYKYSDMRKGVDTRTLSAEILTDCGNCLLETLNFFFYMLLKVEILWHFYQYITLWSF